MTSELWSAASSIFPILAAMAVVAAVEVLIPLRARGPWSRRHLGPNLALTFVTFATNLLLSAALVAALVASTSMGVGLLPPLGLHPWLEGGVAVLVLDLSFYAAHVAMHRVPVLWRFHRVHHSDPAVDVTTTIRQHPGEGLIRYAFTGAFALAAGVTPGAFVVYRLAVALSGLLEHANVRVPARLDAALALVVTWPGLHKLHHARDARWTDTNYGNLVSWWDRLFGTFTPVRYASEVEYGLDGLDDVATQTTAGLLALPFRGAGAARGGAARAALSSR